ncbi:MAG TPA: carbon starvation CstA family protein [Blastocatellia bacterium]|nr:carbon starvation CstA family protein [Blastocatellia bacterium]
MVSINAVPILIGVLCIYVIAYRYYSAFIAAKVLALDDSRVTPAHRFYDGQNYTPTNKYVLWGHHFAAISGPGPLIGPVLAAQFGFLPGILWLVIGVVIGGAVHDFVVLVSSMRHDGKSLAEIARREIDKVTGVVATLAILLILIVALAGLGLAVVNALADSPWGMFTIAMTIPIALFMGIYMYRIRGGTQRGITEGTVVGVILLILAVVFGQVVQDSSWAHYFRFGKNGITIAIAIYGFAASVLPVWLLLCPRDYLSSYMKIGSIALLAVGIFIVMPTFKMPPLTPFVSGGGPIIPGSVFPFVFITIACGAISGFHALVASGTTPKMIDKETHARPIGYGGMLMESVVGVMALIAAASMFPHDYFQINIPVEAFAKVDASLRSMGFTESNLQSLTAAVGEERLAGRTGGAVSLAVGMAQIFTAIPGMRGLMSYWYHFAIMFEALFILTTVDTGTRVARFLMQEVLGAVYRPFARTDWLPGAIIASLLAVCSWSYFIWTGSISTIWPLFGMANQMLACVALCVGTTVIINAGRARYAWVTIVPLAFVSVIEMVAGYQNIAGNYWPLTANPATSFRGYLYTIITAFLMTGLTIVIIGSLRKWYQVVIKGKPHEPMLQEPAVAG